MDNVFKVEESKQIDSFQQRVFGVLTDLTFDAHYNLPAQSMAQVQECRGMLKKSISKVFWSISPVKTLVFISSRMQCKADETVVNTEVKLALPLALDDLTSCAQNAEEVTLICAFDEFTKSKGLEIIQLCSDGTALLNDFLQRVIHYDILR